MANRTEATETPTPVHRAICLTFIIYFCDVHAAMSKSHKPQYV